MPPDSFVSSTAPIKRAELPNWRVRLSYGFGGILDQWGVFGTKSTSNVVFNIVLGVSPAAIGTVVAISRLWDAFADPLMGSISDNTRTRWGRRKPYIVAGAILCGLLFPLVWWVPPTWSSSAQFGWLLITLLAFYSAFTIFTVPYHALGYELAPTYHGKTSLLVVRTVIAQTISIVLGWTLPILQSGWLGAPQPSVRTLGLIVGGTILISGLIPGLLAPVEVAPVQTSSIRPKIDLRKSLKQVFGSGPMRLVLGATATTLFCINIVNVLGSYVTVYHVFHGNVKAAAPLIALSNSLWAILSMALAPVMGWCSRLFGKRNTFMAALGFTLIASSLKWWLYTPSHPYWQIGVILLIAPGTVGLWLLSESMVADICEYEQLRTGKRNEGTFGAVYAWVLKAAIAVAVLVGNLVLEFTGFDVALGAAQSPTTILWLRLLFAFLPAIAVVGSLILLARYPLSSAQMAEVRQQLDRREKRIANS